MPATRDGHATRRFVRIRSDARRPRTLGAWLRTLSPARLLVLSFLALIALGTIGLKALPALYVAEGLGWLDALFTATAPFASPV